MVTGPPLRLFNVFILPPEVRGVAGTDRESFFVRLLLACAPNEDIPEVLEPPVSPWEKCPDIGEKSVIILVVSRGDIPEAGALIGPVTFIDPTRCKPCRFCGLCDFWEPFFKLEESAFKFEEREAAAAAAAAPLPLIELAFVLPVLLLLVLLLFLLLAILPV